MENPNLRLFERAQREALKKAANDNAPAKSFDQYLKEEITKLEKEDAVKAHIMRDTFFDNPCKRSWHEF